MSTTDRMNPSVLFGGDYFCATSGCELHVREGDSGVQGHGNWAVRADGSFASRSRYGEAMLCDVCGRQWLLRQRVS